MSYDPTATQAANPHLDDYALPDDSRDHPTNWAHPPSDGHANNQHANFDGDGDND